MPQETLQQQNRLVCKYCGSEAVSKFGAYKGVQRYWCKACKRKFKADDTDAYHEGAEVRRVPQGY